MHQSNMQAHGARGEPKLGGNVPPHLPPGLLNELCEQVLSAYSVAPHGGIEVGMVLFGKRVGGTAHIQGWRPIPCSHLLGPRFILAPADEALIPGVLSTPDWDPTLAGMEPVGWCCSHTRSDLNLLARDMDFHERYFRKPGDLAVILKPRTPLKAEGLVFGRRADGVIETSEPLLTLQLPAAEVAAPPIPINLLKPTSEDVIELRPPIASATSAVTRFTSRKALPVAIWRWQVHHIGVLGCLVAILTMLVYALWHEHPRSAPPPVPTLSVTLKPTAAGLALVWKSNLPESSSAKANILDETGANSVDLTGSFEPSGVLVLPHQSGNVQAELSVQSGRSTYTGKAAYIDPHPQVVAAPPAPAPTSKKTAKPSRRRRHRRAG